jgi:seryl-tRNA synthetase
MADPDTMNDVLKIVNPMQGAIKSLGDAGKSRDANIKALGETIKATQDRFKILVETQKSIKKDIDSLKKQSNEKEYRQLIAGVKQLNTKVENLKKLISEQEKRHVKLVDDSIKNFDKVIRGVIAKEVAKVAKSKK